MKQDQDSPTTIFCDNMFSIAMIKNHIFHKCTKQFKLRFHFIRKKVEKKGIKLKFYKTKRLIGRYFYESKFSKQVSLLLTKLCILQYLRKGIKI